MRLSEALSTGKDFKRPSWNIDRVGKKGKEAI